MYHFYHKKILVISTLAVAGLVFVSFLGHNVFAAKDKDDVALDNFQGKYNQAEKIKTKYEMEGASLKRVAKDDPKDRIEVTVGNKDNAEFSPDLKIARWDDEVNLVLKPKELDKVAKQDKSLKFENDKIKLETPKVDYTTYEIAPNMELPEGGFEYQIDLKEKPATNKIEFTLENEGLDFFYQPALTQEIGQDGIVTATETQGFDKNGKVIAQRPENVVGSYAVYASEEKINYVGGKVYGTGKVGHIYRPKIIDSAGKEVWGELNIDPGKGILAVTIPQEFLDKAVYPVMHATGLTFGYTGVGASGIGSSLNQMFGYLFTSPSDISGAIVNSMTADVRGQSTTGNIKFVITDSSKAIITNGVTNSGAITASYQWVTSTFSTSPALSNSTAYYLEAVGDVNWSIKADNVGGTGDCYDSSNSYATPQDPTGCASYGYKSSIYVTYNVAPTISSVSDTPDPQVVGSNVTFSVAWADADAGDQTKIHLCKTNSLTGTACTGGSWCDTSSFSASSPTTCAYTVQTADVATSPNSYYAFVCDDDNACSAGTAGTWSAYATSSPSFTLSAWVKPTTAIATKAIAVKNNAIRLVTDASGKPVCQIYNGTAWQTAATSTAALVLNSWQYVSCTYDRSNIKIYINGVLQMTQAMSNIDIQDTTSTLDLGHDAGSTYADFQGYIDDFKFYKYARSAVQIKADYVGVATKRGATARSVTVGEQQDASEGLVSYWKMDEASWAGAAGEVIDASGNGNNGTAVGGASTTSPAKFGRAGSFDGTDDYVGLTSTNYGTIYTTSFWLNYNSGQNTTVIMGGSGVSQGYMAAIFGSNPTDMIYHNAAGIFVGVVHGGFTNGIWYHIVIVRNGTSVKFYKNGIQIGTTQTLSSNPSIIIGAIGNYTGGGYPLKGILDDVKIYNKARTADQIRRDFDSGPPPVAHWKMDENTGQYAYDTSGVNNSTLGTGATPDSADPVWTSGKYGNALKFDGANDYIMSTTSGTSLSALTIGLWVKRNSSATTDGIFQWADQISSTGPFIYLRDTSGTLNYYVNSGYNLPGGVLADNTWTYLTLTWDGSAWKAYKNSVYFGSYNAGGGAVQSNSTNFWLANGYNGYWDGLLDDVRIYNYARTSKQILEDMNAGHPAVGSPVGSYAGYWSLDEMQGTTAYDKSVNDNDLTLSTASWTTSGKFGGAFDGADNKRITQAADDPDFDFVAADDLSVSLWFKSDAAANPGAVQYLLSKNASGLGYAVYADTNGYLNFGIDDDTSSFPEDTAQAAKDFYDNTWHHLVATKIGTARIEIYIDGVLRGSDATISATGTLENTGKLILNDYNETDGTDEFIGDIDEVKIYRFALSPAEIKEEYNRGASLVLGAGSTASDGKTPSSSQDRSYCVPGDTTACAAPVAQWKMDEKTGQYANDVSGSGNTGTLGASASPASDDPQWKSSASCKSGSCLSFDGVNDYVNMGIVLDFPTDFTMSAWIKTSSAWPGSPMHIISHYNNSGIYNYFLSIGDPNTGAMKVGFTIGDGWGNAPTVESTITVNDGVWHYLTAKRSGTVMSLYIDGKLNNTGTYSGNAPSGTGRDFTIGVSSYVPWGLYFNGSVDDVRIYNYARTAAQVAWDYNRGAPIAWWKMNDGQNSSSTCDGTGSTLADASGNGLTGTLSLSGSPATSTAWVEGKYNCALDFDGTNDYVSVPDNDKLSFGNGTVDTPYSISLWVKSPNVATAADSLVSKYAASNHEYQSGLTSDRIYSWVYDNSASQYKGRYASNASTYIANNTWAFITLTYSGGGTNASTKIYINGIQRDDTDFGSAGTYTAMENLGQPLLIGGGTDGIAGYWEGSIDDVRMYNYALTATQVKTVFNEGSAVRFGPTEGLP